MVPKAASSASILARSSRRRSLLAYLGAAGLGHYGVSASNSQLAGVLDVSERSVRRYLRAEGRERTPPVRAVGAGDSGFVKYVHDLRLGIDEAMPAAELGGIGELLPEILEAWHGGAAP